MNKAIKIGAVICLLTYLSSYIIFSVNLKITGVKLDILFALSMHISIMISALIFYLKIKSAFVRALSVYTVLFCFISIVSFIYVGLILDKSYFMNKFALIASAPLTLGYELIIYFIRTRHRNN
jgi:hypothetical protein